MGERPEVYPEGFDYARLDSQIEKIAFKKRANTPYYYKFRAAKRWILVASIALVTGGIAAMLTTAIRKITKWKFSWISGAFTHLYEDFDDSNPSGRELAIFYAFLRSLLFSLSLALLGAAVANVEPMSCGGGVTKVKALLNGMKVPRAVRAQTLVCKIIGTMCTVTAGLPMGKLAPLIHCGAIVGGGLSQGKTVSCKSCPTKDGKPWKQKISIVGRRDFRNDREKRGFVTMGTAAGVAAAFGAPVGGVLMCLEEGASWWSPRLNWRMTFCAMASSFCTSLFLSCVSTNGDIELKHVSDVDQPGAFSFGKFLTDEYSLTEIPLFMILGVIGGLVGAAFNTMFLRLHMYRREKMHDRYWKIFLEVVVQVLLVSTISFGVPMLIPACHSDVREPNNTFHSDRVQQFTCGNVNDYSETASMFLLPPTSSVKWIMHTEGNFDNRALLIFFVCNILLTCVGSSGMRISGGRFVPLIASGCAMGRLFGQTIAHPFNQVILHRERTTGL
eukprot:g3357.t1